MASHQLTLAQRIGINYYRTKILMLKKVSEEAAAKAAFDIFTKPFDNGKRKDTPFFKHAHKFSFQSQSCNLVGYHFISDFPAGKKLLIIHGFAGSCRAFEKYISPALKKGYEVFTFDAPAHGLSSGKRLNTYMYSEVIASLIKTYGIFDAYISHSLGGLALMLTLEKLPQAKPPKVVLIAPATESTTAADNFFSILQLPGGLRMAFEELIFKMRNQPLSWYSVSRVLPFITADILWIHDEDDPTTPIKDVIPIVALKPKNVQFYFTKGLGHSRIYRDQTVTKLIADFL